MNLQIEIDDDVREDVKCCVRDWLNEVAAWSQARYPAVDLEAGTTIAIRTHEWFSGVTLKPQKHPNEIQMSDLLDYIHWSEDIRQREWFRSGHFYVANKIGMQAGLVGLLRTVQFTLAKDIPDDAFREGWDADVTPQEEKLAWLQEVHPELVKSWVDRSGWMDQFRKGIRKSRWSFPAVNEKLCRSPKSWGPGAVFPPDAGRS